MLTRARARSTRAGQPIHQFDKERHSMPKELTWRKAIEKVLSEAPGVMHYKDITDKIIEDGLRSSLGATPPATVSSVLCMALNEDGDHCPFQRIDRGLFIWKAKA